MYQSSRAAYLGADQTFLIVTLFSSLSVSGLASKHEAEMIHAQSSVAWEEVWAFV